MTRKVIESTAKEGIRVLTGATDLHTLKEIGVLLLIEKGISVSRVRFLRLSLNVTKTVLNISGKQQQYNRGKMMNNQVL